MALALAMAMAIAIATAMVIAIVLVQALAIALPVLWPYLQIMVQPGSLAARKYSSSQKLFRTCTAVCQIYL